MLVLTQSVAAPDLHKWQNTDNRCIGKSKENHKEGNARSDFDATEAFDNDVVAVVTNHDDHPQGGNTLKWNISLFQVSNTYFRDKV